MRHGKSETDAVAGEVTECRLESSDFSFLKHLISSEDSYVKSVHSSAVKHTLRHEVG